MFPVGRSPRASLLTLLVALQAPATSYADLGDLGSASFTQTVQKRISRTVFEYSYSVTARNSGDVECSGVAAAVTSGVPETVIVAGALSFGTMAAGAAGTSGTSLVLRHDRRVPFDFANLSIAFSATNPACEADFIGAAGGTRSSADGKAVVVIPPGALASDQLITVTPVASSPEGAIAAYDFGPDGLQFDQPVTLTIAYGEGDLPAGISEAELLLRTLQGDQWAAIGEIEGSSVDTVRNIVSAQTTHFTTFGIFPASLLPLPTVSLSANPSSGPAPLLITLTAAAFDPDGGPIVSYEWDFEGDGVFDQTTVLDSISHSYSLGSFSPNVRVTDDESQTADAAASVSVGTANPTVSLLAVPASGAPPLLVTFTATASDPDGGIITTHEWDLNGDGLFEQNTGTTNTAAQLYILPGLFTGPTAARVRVTDDDGETAEAVVAVTVTLPLPQNPTVSAGDAHTCSTSGSGTVTCWGSNLFGQLGNGTKSGNTPPVQVSGINDAAAVSSGQLHSCALHSGGAVSCWGENSDGQLGNRTRVDSTVPVPVSGITAAIAVSAGTAHSCALLVDGTVSCWGNNRAGQLGDGTNVASTAPVPVSGIVGATAISAGGAHSCALLSGGTLRCWGSNAFGQLGDGTNSDSNVPVPVSGISTALAVSAGKETHTCALLSGGTLRCWGSNSFGELGNGTNLNSSVPVPVSGITTAVSVSAGVNHTCAVLTGGTANCWGRNDSAQLGDGTNSDSTTPTLVSAVSTAIAVSAGFTHSCALLPNLSVGCWGFNLSLSATPSQGRAPLAVTFSAEALLPDPAGGSIVTHEWDFDGDGTFDQNTGPTNTVSHTYNTIGNFEAKVRATDDRGQTVATTTQIEVGFVEGLGILTRSGRIVATLAGSNSSEELSFPIGNVSGFVTALNTALAGVNRIDGAGIILEEPVVLPLSLNAELNQLFVSASASACGSSLSLTTGDVRMRFDESGGDATIQGCLANSSLTVGDVDRDLTVRGIDGTVMSLDVTAGAVGRALVFGGLPGSALRSSTVNVDASRFQSVDIVRIVNSTIHVDGSFSLGIGAVSELFLAANTNLGLVLTTGGDLDRFTVDTTEFSPASVISVGDVVVGSGIPPEGQVIINANKGLPLNAITMGRVDGNLTITNNEGFDDPAANQFAQGRSVGGTITIFGNHR